MEEETKTMVQKNRPQRKADTVTFLRNATMSIVDAFNKRQFNIDAPPWSTYCRRDFFSGKTSSESGQIVTTNLQGLVDGLRQLSVRNPNRRHQLVEISVVVDMDAGTATVYGLVSLLDDHAPPTQSIGVVEWKQFDGRWFCIKHGGLQGMGGESMVGRTAESVDDWDAMINWR